MLFFVVHIKAVGCVAPVRKIQLNHRAVALVADAADFRCAAVGIPFTVLVCRSAGIYTEAEMLIFRIGI